MSSREKLKQNVPNPSKRRLSRSAVEASADWLRLPNELWCSVFSYLPLMDLLCVEQVSQRWNDLVDLQLSGRGPLRLTMIVDYSTCNKNNIHINNVGRMLEGYGQNLKELTIIDACKFESNRMVERIGDWCPNLVKLVLAGETSVSNIALHEVAEKCVQLQSLSLLGLSTFNYSVMAVALMKLKQLKQLKIDFHNSLHVHDTCLFYMSRNVEDLTLRNVTGLAMLFYSNLNINHTNLHKLDISTTKDLDGIFVDTFSEKCVNIKELSLECPIDNKLLKEICKMRWLEKLHIKSSSRIDDRRLKLIAKGYPNLRAFSLVGSHITDKGVKYLIEHCLQSVELDLSRNQKLTDVVLVHLAASGRVSWLAIRGCRSIADRGCIYFFARCPQLLSMDIRHCPQLTTAIVQPCTSAVRHRTDRMPLTLMVKGTSIELSDVKIDCPRLTVDFQETSIVDFYHKSWSYSKLY